MNSMKEQFGKVSKRRAVATAGTALALLIAGGEAAGLAAQGSAIVVEGERDKWQRYSPSSIATLGR